MIIKTDTRFGLTLTEIWPFVEDEADEQGLAFGARIIIRNDGTVAYQGNDWTPAEFEKLCLAFEKAFELTKKEATNA